MDNKGPKLHVKNLISTFEQQQRIIRPKVLIPKKPQPIIQNDNGSSSEDVEYDEVREPSQKPTNLHEISVEEASTSQDSQYSKFDRYLNAPEIVEETQNFLAEEENYSELLSDLVENYVTIINTDKFDDVFGEIGQICTFQNSTFLPDLKNSRNIMEIVDCFIRHKKWFSIYYEYYFNNQPNMILIMTGNKDIFKAGLSPAAYKEIEEKLIKSLNKQIQSYYNFLKSMKNILEPDIDTSDFDRALDIIDDLISLFSRGDEKIRYVISEIVETERVYIEKLERITEQIIPKIEKVIKRRTTQISIIGNVPAIYKLQLDFHKDLEQCLITFIPNDIGNCFLQHENCFIEYVKDQQLKNNPDAIEECRELLKEESNEQVDFHAPFNRICKYKLLLQELKKSCDKKGEPFGKVEDAFNMIISIILKMNGIAAINCIQDENLDLDNQGKLIIRDEFIIKSKEHQYDAMVFLFEKSIVLTEIKTEGSKKFRSDVFVYKNHIITKYLSYSINPESATNFQVFFHGSAKKMLYTLKATDENTKKTWISTLNNILMTQLEEEKRKVNSN